MRYAAFLIGILCLFQCKSTKNASDDNGTSLGQECIRFGSGGGFTGKVNSYALYRNGTLKEAKSDRTLKELSEQEVEQAFANYQTLGLSKMMMDSPGNMYSFVEMDLGGQKHRLTWGSREANEPRELRIYHANLMRHTRTKKVQQDKSKYPTK